MAKKKNSEELIHVRFDYDELVESKRKILSIQMALLKILKIVRTYKLLRDEELKRKIVLRNEMVDFNRNIGKMKTELPKLKIPKILKREESEFSKEEEESSKRPILDKSANSDLDFELQKIQNELKKLQ